MFSILIYSGPGSEDYGFHPQRPKEAATTTITSFNLTADRPDRGTNVFVRLIVPRIVPLNRTLISNFQALIKKTEELLV
jgi:hypothetical protein